MKAAFLLALILFFSFSGNISATELVVTNPADDGEGSLRFMLDLAEENDIIVFDSSLKGAVITVSSPLEIKKRLAVNGLIEDEYIALSGGEESRIFEIEGGDAYFYNILFTDAQEGAILAEEGVVLHFGNCRFRDNRSSGRGAAVNGEQLNFTNCSFEDNTSANGGAVYCAGGRFTNCSFFRNISENDGGAVYVTDFAILSDCRLVSNMAGNGGAVYINGTGSSSFSDCSFSDNSAVLNGGGVHYLPGSETENDIFTRCTFQFNSAGTNGGAIFAEEAAGSFSRITNCTFSNNRASKNGGGVSLSGGGEFIKNTFFRNTTRAGGCAIWGSSGNAEEITCKGNIFFNNGLMETGDPEDVQSVISAGYNIYTSLQSDVFFHTGDSYFFPDEEESLLLPLGDNGGKTPTMYINTSLEGWEEIVRIIPLEEIEGILVDQRNFLLPEEGLVCAGALEVGATGETKIKTVVPDKIRVYPNPAMEYICFTLNEPALVQLYTISGHLVVSRKYEAGEIRMDVSSCTKGIYLLKINNRSVKVLKN